MTETSTSSSLKDLAMRNSLFEKRLTGIQKHQEEQARLSTLYSQSRGYLEKLVSQTSEKLDFASKEVEARCRENKSFVDEAINNLSSMLSDVDLLSDAKDKVIDESLLNKYLNFPHDLLVKKLENVKLKLENELKNLNESTDSTVAKIESIQKSRSALSKERSKEEKNISEWMEIIEKKTEVTATFEAEFSAKNDQLSKLEADFQSLEFKKTEEVRKLAELDEKLEKAAENKESISRDRLEKKNADLQNLEDRIQKITSISKYDELIPSDFPQNEKISALLLELEQSSKNLAELTTTVGDATNLFEMSEGDDLEVLKTENEFLEEQKQKLEAELAEKKTLREQLLLVQKENNDQTTDLDNMKERIREKSSKLKLEVLMKIREEQIQMQKNDYITPKTKIIHLKKPNRNVSFKSDSTKVVEEVDDSPYPGIKPFSRSTKKKIAEVLREVPVVRDVSFENSMDFSQLSADTGTTQEGSMMGGIFSPLRNRIDEEEEEDADNDVEEDSTDFSMADHFRDYNDRSLNNNKTKNTETFSTFQDTLSRKVSSNAAIDSPSERSSNTSESSVLPVSLNEADDDVDSADDSLMANDSDMDMDQSDWGE